MQKRDHVRHSSATINILSKAVSVLWCCLSCILADCYVSWAMIIPHFAFYFDKDRSYPVGILAISYSLYMTCYLCIFNFSHCMLGHVTVCYRVTSKFILWVPISKSINTMSLADPNADLLPKKRSQGKATGYSSHINFSIPFLTAKKSRKICTKSYHDLFTFSYQWATKYRLICTTQRMHWTMQAQLKDILANSVIL